MINVVAAVIRDSDKYLIGRRRSGKSLAGKWEFPGGKVEDDETPKEALQREILEELGINVAVKEELTTVEHRYNEIAIRLKAFHVSTEQIPLSSTDHDILEWVTIPEMHRYDMAEADLPLIAQLELRSIDERRE